MEVNKNEQKNTESLSENITSEITSFFAFTKNKEKYEIKLYSADHDNLIFQCIFQEGISIKKFKKIKHIDELKKENKLFTICDNINEIKTLIIDYIKNSTSKDEYSILAIKEEKRIIIKIPTLINKIKEIIIILEEKERNIEEIIDNLEKNINKLIIENESNKKEFEAKLNENNNKIKNIETRLQKMVACPDYKKPLSIKSGFTVKEKGYILFSGLARGEGKNGYINNLHVFTYGHYDGGFVNYNGSNICIYPVSTGDIVTFDDPINTYFLPEII